MAALAGEGGITWDSRISDLDPAFEMYDPWVTREITIRDLFCHRSGLPEHAGDLLEDLGFTREQILHRLIDGKWVQKYQRDPDPESPAGRVSSSVNDLAKWLRLQLAGGKFDGDQIVAEEPLAASHLPQIMINPSSASGIPQFYGLGWNVNYDSNGRLRLSHSGAFALGAATNVNMSPGDRLASSY